LYFLAMQVLLVLGCVSRFGLDNAILKTISAHSVRGCDRSAKNMLGMSLLVSIFTALFIGGFLAYFSREIASGFFSKPALDELLSLCALVLVPVVIFNLLSEALKASGKVASATFIQTVCVQFIVVACLLLFGADGPEIIFQYFFLGCVTAVIIALYRLRNSYSGGGWYEGYTFKKVWTDSRPLFTIALLNVAMASCDVIMLGWQSDEIQVGLYGVANRLSMVGVLLLSVVNGIAGPEFSRLWELKDASGLRNRLQFYTKWMSVAATLFLLFFIICGESLLRFFGPDFMQAEGVLVCLTVGQFIALSTGPVAYFLMMTGKDKVHRKATLIAACCNVLLNFYLIPLYGAMGAALATSISLSCKNIFSYLYLRREFKVGSYA
ncbi:MAG: polysaccharide biosynthesis C-terminal domain-containing protein, partial [Colwellia sp.]|jgi:Membrane protein involved in the export of O-antigen and teichoic acid